MTKKNRIITIVLVIAFTLVMLYSTSFIVKEYGHECASEKCPICYQINVCENTLKLLSFVVGTASVLVALIYTIVRFTSSIEKDYIHTTLITLKVKLSD